MPIRPTITVLASLVLVLTGCGGDDRGAGTGDEATTTVADDTTSGPATSSPPGTDPETSATDDTSAEGDAAQRFPDVVEAELTASGATWSVAATVSSPYDSPERYADAFRVLAPDGTELGVRELLHDHAGEQPFTRSLDDLDIPDDVDEVTVEGRDLANGWGGDTVTVAVPR